MPQINVKSTAGTATRNLGVAQVTFNPSRLAYAMLVPKGTVLSGADLATIKKTLQDKLFADAWVERFQITPKAVGTEPAGEAAKKETSPNGDSRNVNPAKVVWVVTFWKGGKDFHTSATGLNGMEDVYDLFYVDEKNNLCGTLIEGSNSVLDGIKGYALSDLFTDTAMLPGADKGFETKMSFSLADESEFNARFAFVELGFPASQLKSVVDVDLALVGVEGAGIITLAPKAGAQNLVASFPTVLNGLTMWQTYRQDTGALVPITAIAPVAGQGFRLTHTVTGIPAQTQMQTRLAPVSVLKAAGLVGFESSVYNWVTA